MFTYLAKALRLLRARWRWGCGRCPLCNRNPCAPFAYYMAAYPNCPVCKDATGTDLLMWHNYMALGTDKKLAFARVKE
jgi:hypothetical protein